MRLFLAVSMAALLLGPTTLAAAQEPTGASLASMLTIGTRVRVLSTSVQTRLPGVVVAVDDTVLTLTPDGGLPLKVPVDSITAVDVSLGRKRNWLRGLGIGVVSGVALGLAFAVDPEDCGPDSTKFCSRGEAIAASTVVCSAFGAGIGALIKSERWAPITVGFRPSGLTTRRPVVDVALAVRF